MYMYVLYVKNNKFYFFSEVIFEIMLILLCFFCKIIKLKMKMFVFIFMDEINLIVVLIFIFMVIKYFI